MFFVLNSKFTFFILSGILVLSALGFSQDAIAQFQSGGVDKEGTWHVGEGLEEGQNFTYTLCHIDYQDCLPIDLSMTAQSNLVDKWDIRFEFNDGTVSLNDVAEVDKVTFEALNIDPNDKPLFDAYENSIVWLSHFANVDNPKDFNAASWGKIGNIGGAQIVPTTIETITVPAGTWETVVISWNSGGVTNKVWIVDDLPFPIKAETFTHVSEGIPPQEYKFELLSVSFESDPEPDAKLSDKEIKKLTKQVDKMEKQSLKFESKANKFFDKSQLLEDKGKQSKADEFFKKAQNYLAQSEILKSLSQTLRDLIQLYI